MDDFTMRAKALEMAINGGGGGDPSAESVVKRAEVFYRLPRGRPANDSSAVKAVA